MSSEPTGSAPSAPSQLGSAEVSTGVPAGSYARKATGLVREVSLTDMIAFNASAVGGIAFALLVGLFYAFAAFPGGNLILGIVIALPLAGFVWVTFALVGSVFPRVGGDYVFGSRVLHPIVGLASNISVFASTILALGFFLALVCTTVAVGPMLAVIGTVTGHIWWINAATTIGEHTWQLIIAITMAVLITGLSLARTRLITRVVAISLGVSYLGFLAAFFILLFTSHAHFVQTLNDFSNPITGQSDTYAATIKAGAKAGVQYPGDHGYSVKNTFGMVYVGLSVMLWIWWGVYMSGEMKGAGQRRRQLTAILGAGYGQSLLVLLAALVFIGTIGYNFFAAANAGAYAVPVSPYFNFFAAIVAGNRVVAILISIALLGFIIPGIYINFAMCQRALFAWAFDGLLPRKVASVNDRTHTPIVAILTVAVGGVACAAYAIYASNFLTLLAVTAAMLFMPMFVTGVVGLVLPTRRPELYRGSPADWRWHGIPMLRVASAGCIAVSLIFISLLCYFHENLGVASFWTMPLLIPASVVVAGIWYVVARAIQRRRGVDLDLVYRSIPPE